MTPERFARLKDILQRRQTDLTVIMEGVHNPRNMAAVARSADSVGIQYLHAIGETKMRRLTQNAAGGVGHYVDVTTHPDVKQCYVALKNQGMQILSAHFTKQSVDFRDIDYTKPTALIVGSESVGVSEEASQRCDQHVVIPMLGAAQSLNVSVATALILSEAQRQRIHAGMYKQCAFNEQTYQEKLFEWCHPKIARWCRLKKKEYPELDEHGDFSWD